MLTLSIVELDGLEFGKFLYVFNSEDLTNTFYKVDWINQKETMKSYVIDPKNAWKLNNMKIKHVIAVIPYTIYYGFHLEALFLKIKEYKAKYNFTLIYNEKIPEFGLETLDKTLQLKTLDQIAALIVRTHVQEIVWKLRASRTASDLHSYKLENAEIVATFPKSFYS